MTTVYLIIALVIVVVVAGFSIRGNIVNSAKLRETIKNNEKVKEVEKTATEKRNEIEEENNDEKNNVISNPGHDHGVLPDGEIIAHNHTHDKPCTPDCPAYNKS